MNTNWWITPVSLHGDNSGGRPSGTELLDLVDTTDPAFMHIVTVLRDTRDTGIELDAETVAEAVRVGRLRWSERDEPKQPSEPIAPEYASIVYYLLRGPLVKIGTTGAPARRFAALMPDEILAVEPGEQPQERQRHLQFQHLRVGTSEYFLREPDLDTHIQAIRARYGAPDPAWPTTQNLTRPRNDFHPKPPQPASAELVTVAQAADRLGVRRHTVSGWVYRELLKPVGKNELGRRLYLLDEMAFLAARSSRLTG